MGRSGGPVPRAANPGRPAAEGAQGRDLADMSINRLPLPGVLVSLTLFALAAASYPGGYDWANHFISMLFAPSTATGAANEARSLAVAAMLVLCVSVAVLFEVLSRRAGRRVHGKTLEIGGIGSMVYAFLAVTPMHDLVVGIALLFFVPAMSAAIHLLYVERRFALFWVGLMCLGLLLACATMYYGHVLWYLLPLAQKASFVACVGWLLAMQFATEDRARNDKGLA
jgi:hypothetical protein